MCDHCGHGGSHFVPPSLGDPGVFACEVCCELCVAKIGTLGKCSKGRIGVITGRKDLPWGMSWVGIGLDDGSLWSARDPQPVETYELVHLANDKATLPSRSREAIAKRFHELYEELAPDFGYETRAESAVSWPEVPACNRQLMIAVIDALIREEVI